MNVHFVQIANYVMMNAISVFKNHLRLIQKVNIGRLIISLNQEMSLNNLVKSIYLIAMFVYMNLTLY